MSTNLLQANREWATRPADQRFWSLDDLHRKAEACRQEARVATVASRDLVIAATEDSDLRLLGKAGIEARLTNYSFLSACGARRSPGWLSGFAPGRACRAQPEPWARATSGTG